jgi:hypothetical protein
VEKMARAFRVLQIDTLRDSNEVKANV